MTKVRHYPFPQEDVDLFQGVTNDEDYVEVEVRKDLLKEKKELEKKLAEVERDLGDFDNKVKKEKAKRLYIPKDSFLIREQLYRMELFIKNLNDFLSQGDSTGVVNAMNCEIRNIQNMNNYLANSDVNSTDILYDFGKSAKIYEKIKQNNVNYERINEELGQIEIRKAHLVPLSGKERGNLSSGDQ